MKAAYLDASALVKLIRREPESDALVNELKKWPVWISNELVAVEIRCTVLRMGVNDLHGPAQAVLDRLDLVLHSPVIQQKALEAEFKPSLRALDTLHLATAMTIGSDIDILVAYDHELLKAAENQGLNVSSPGVSA